MVDKLLLIKMILETDADTDRKILALLESSSLSYDENEFVIDMEDRACGRKSVDFTASMNVAGKAVAATVKDLSLSGAFINTDHEIQRGEKLAISFIAPGGSDFALSSEVVRVTPSGIGIMIKSIDDMQLEKFQNFVRKL